MDALFGLILEIGFRRSVEGREAEHPVYGQAKKTSDEESFLVGILQLIAVRISLRCLSKSFKG